MLFVGPEERFLGPEKRFLEREKRSLGREIRFVGPKKRLVRREMLSLRSPSRFFRRLKAFVSAEVSYVPRPIDPVGAGIGGICAEVRGIDAENGLERAATRGIGCDIRFSRPLKRVERAAIVELLSEIACARAMEVVVARAEGFVG